MFRCLAVLPLVVLLTGCAQPPGENASVPRDTAGTAQPAPGESTAAIPARQELPVGLALKDDGRTVQLAPGQVVMVSLRANHTTGYRWVLADSAPGVLAREGEPAYDVDSTSGVGAGGFETWRFRVRKAGRGVIVLEYRRPWEKAARPETTVRYVILAR